MKYSNSVIFDIFDKYDKKLSNDATDDTSEITLDLEIELRKKLDIGYQEVKNIILNLYAKHRYKKLCYAYMVNHQCSEFDHIIE